MKLLNISDIKSTPNKSVIREYDEEDEYEGYSIYSNKCAIFIAKSDADILEDIKSIYEKTFASSKIPIGFEKGTGALKYDIDNCPKCGASELKSGNIRYGDDYSLKCQHCRFEFTITSPDNTITIHRYSQEQLLIVELYDECMNPYPDNIIFTKALIESTST